MIFVVYIGNCGKCDGDVIFIFVLKNIWIDYCYLVKVVDGLIDVICDFIDVFIMNNYFIKYDKVMKIIL